MLMALIARKNEIITVLMDKNAKIVRKVECESPIMISIGMC